MPRSTISPGEADTMGEEAYFYRDEVSRLQVVLDEATRAKPGSPESRFVAPEAGVIDRLEARFHHIVYGRRGAGKSSLLRQLEHGQRQAGHLVAWADQETFQGNSYPDVLVGTLEQVFAQFAQQLRDSEEPKKRRWWQRAPAPSTRAEVAAKLDDVAAQLLALRSEPSDAQVVWKASSSERTSSGSTAELKGGAKGGPAEFGAGYSSNQQRDATTGDEFERRYNTSKTEHLERAVSTYRALLEEVAAVAPDMFIILDDFYRLAETDQARIAGYFHRVVKDTSAWLKLGSIRYWTKLYAGGSPTVGMQAPHDIRELSLDRHLDNFDTSKRFLEKILEALATEVGVDVDQLLGSGSRDRLVLAAGGVPRDYLGLIGEAITVARNRGPSTKAGSDRITAEDANKAAGRTVETKFDDLSVDAGQEALDLSRLVFEVTHHCRTTKTAWFLADTSNDHLIRRLNRLQNMRFIHALDMHETLPDQSSARYNVYLLDVSQLTAQRASQVDFMGWRQREKRRVRRLVFAESDERESGQFSDVEGVAAALAVPEPSTEVQGDLFEDDADAVMGTVDPAVEPPL